ncbi:hypothetical protein [Bordetella hinzii]|uniref:hypothetical protein n=1 Tax=Bordetella hinzii TaxID=103855 RepID=UPI00068EBE8F|nr:hypothetical protein [Bordetella hinzii]
MLAIIFFWLLFAVIVGMMASSRGRSGFGWFILACLISPLVAGVFVLLVTNKAAERERPHPSTHIKCPDCKELILKDARVCRFCGCRLVSQTAEPEPSRLKTIIGDIPDTGASKVLYWVGVAIVLAVIIWISKH